MRIDTGARGVVVILGDSGKGSDSDRAGAVFRNVESAGGSNNVNAWIARGLIYRGGGRHVGESAARSSPCDALTGRIVLHDCGEFQTLRSRDAATPGRNGDAEVGRNSEDSNIGAR